MREMFDLKRISVERPYVLGGIFFVILVGVASGIFLERLLPGDDKEAAFGAIESLFFTGANEPSHGFFETFFAYSQCSLISMLLIYISTIVVVLFPLILVALMFNGFSLGFTATLLLDYFGLKGQLLILATVIPFCLISLMVFSFASSASLGYISNLFSKDGLLTFDHKKRRSIVLNMNTPFLLSNIKDFSTKMLSILVISLVLNFIQSFLCLLVG